VDPYLGEIRAVGFNFAPANWMLCDGQLMSIAENEALYQLLGTTYGGDGQSSFALPDLQGRIPIGTGQGTGLSPYALGATGGMEAVVLAEATMPSHSHRFAASLNQANTKLPANAVLGATDDIALYGDAAPTESLAGASIGPSGGSQPHTNLQRYLVINYILNVAGGVPPGGASDGGPDPFVGEIRLFAYNFAPAGWAFCRGQLMQISQNTALFSLLGSTYGGNASTTFALPDLQESVAMGAGQGAGLSNRDLGEEGGESTVTLIGAEMPSHAHALVGSASNGASGTPLPSESLSVSEGGAVYKAKVANPVGLGNELATSGGSLPHNNMQPYLSLNYAIALQGVFPQRS
jgi:microcystin-dependent protein